MSVLVSLGAPSAALSGKMAIQYNEGTGNETYFSVPPGNGRNYYIPPPSVARFDFKLPKSDAYSIWVLMKSPSPENQGYYIYDGGGWFTWLSGVHPNWRWVKIMDSARFSAASFRFVKGLNEFQMGWCDENVQVSQILITNDPDFVPTAVAVNRGMKAY